MASDTDILFAYDFAVNADTSVDLGMGELWQGIDQLRSSFKKLKVTKTEFVTLKAMVLLNSGESTCLSIRCDREAAAVLELFLSKMSSTRCNARSN